MGGDKSLLQRAGGDMAEIVPVVKALFVGDKNGQESNVIVEQSEAEQLFERAGSLKPPYDPNILAMIYENSSALRPNVDAYITNIDSYGHRFKPVLDIEAPDADEKIRNALRMETGKDPSDEKVEKRKEELRVEMREEAERLAIFFESCTVEIPFDGPEGLRGLTRQDIEVLGGGAWEVLRDADNEIVGFNRLPGISVRLMPMDPTNVMVEVRRRKSLLSYKHVDAVRRFRRFVQLFEASGEAVYFKEFGDPRTVSAKTGKVYASEEEMRKVDDEKDAALATEVIYFKISSPRTPYGVPRWVGTLLSVLGTRQAEEVNFLYFENRSIPPLAITVSGGRLNQDTVGRLESYIENHIKGKRNSHKILILEAESAAPGAGYGTGNESDSGRMKIQITPLTGAQQHDAQWLEYDEANRDKVGQAFRLPRLLRGDVRDFNRSTAEASIDFAEVQVFGPIRQQFDWMINQLILPALAIKYHTFESNAPTVRDPAALAEMIAQLVTANVLTPEEARDLATGVFNRPLLKIDSYWTKQPVALTLAGRAVSDNLHTPGIDEGQRYREDGLEEFNAAGGMSAPGAGQTQQALGVPQNKAIAALRKVHEYMLAEERKEFADVQREVIKVPADLFYSFVRPTEPSKTSPTGQMSGPDGQG